MNVIGLGSRVRVNREGGSAYAGTLGTVVKAEHRSLLTGRPVCGVYLDGCVGDPFGDIFYSQELDEMNLVRRCEHCQAVAGTDQAHDYCNVNGYVGPHSWHDELEAAA